MTLIYSLLTLYQVIAFSIEKKTDVSWPCKKVKFYSRRKIIHTGGPGSPFAPACPSQPSCPCCPGNPGGPSGPLSPLRPGNKSQKIVKPLSAVGAVENLELKIKA